jgi:purine-nucleoside phosphorylase
MHASPNQTSSVLSDLDASIRVLAARTGGRKPQVGVVLGSGLGAFGDSLEDVVKVPYAELPHFPPSGVVGHAGNACFGNVSGVSVFCMQGRAHYYEGHSMRAVVHGVRVMARMGVKCVLLTNAAGGLDPTHAPGDFMLIDDHVNLSGTNPLLGANEEGLGPRFPDLTAAYDPGLREAALRVAQREGIALKRGVYAWLTGPTYETPAEVRLLRGLGIHAVGMSTVPEVIALRHMNVPVAAVSCITNLAAGLGGKTLDHSEVEETARARRADFIRLLTQWIRESVAL